MNIKFNKNLIENNNIINELDKLNCDYYTLKQHKDI